MTQKLTAHFKHVGIYVIELEKMANFYQDFFGMTKTDGGQGSVGKGAFLSADPTEHHQVVLVVGREPDSKPTVNQLSFLVPDLTTLKGFHAKALKEEVPINMVKSHGNALSLYVQDPEGNQCEIYCHTPWYVSQPVGKPLDLTLSEEEILAQVEAECRDNPTFMPRQQWIEIMKTQMKSA